MTPADTLMLAAGSAVMLAISLWLIWRANRAVQRAEDALAREKSRVTDLREARLYWLKRANDAGAKVELMAAELKRAQPRDPVTGRLVKRAARKEG